MRLMLVIFTVLIFSAPAAAQQEMPAISLEDYTNMMAAAQYAALAEQVVERPRSFPFGYFRLYYTGTMEYQPRAEIITRQLLDHAYKIQTSEDPVEIAEALSAYEELVKNHLASIKVVLQALSLSRQDERFGDPEFLEWLRDGLFKSLLAESGQENYYVIAALDDEAYLLEELGVEIVSTEIFDAGKIYIKIHEVKKLSTGESFSLMVDASLPMRWLARQKRDAAYTIELRRQ